MPTTSSRLLALLSLLQSRRDWPGEVLAERLDVTSRTVRRDIDRLRELGYRIATFKGPDGGYRLDAGTQLPPMLFDDEQAVALAIALQIASGSGAGTGEAALRALSTVRQVMPPRLRHRVDALSVTAVRPPTDGEDVDPAVLQQIGAVVHAGEVLRFDYGDGDGPVRRAEPHHVASWRGRWYLVGWDLDREDWRTYRVDRVRPRIPNGPRFAPRELPGGDLTTFLTGRFRGNEGSTRWPCEGEAILELPVDEVRPFIGDGLATPVDNRRTRVVLGSWSWPALVASLLRFDADLEVIGPPELAAAVEEVGRRCARAAG
ncbi:WYL domain-containing protein [Nakamurella sp. YIM 132087]|uniref:WYL domain-containing protein n=1 Tax=Nakamurella alba TaxID=2665158 RepID=A0A7K1FES4_9ACTN|nr:WYL domain-containing protein [Nakamurella alba]MTD12602.1 WYL domain-containing protein [Nakamurella alba]